MSDENVTIVTTDADGAIEIMDKPHVEFGLHLSSARIASGMTTLDVAERLKLHEDIIKALEASRIDVLPAAAFTQGYIKAYAKLLKISPDEIMRDYDVMVPNKVASLVVASGVPAEHSSRDVIVKVTSYSLIILALILFVFWVQQSGFELSGNLVKKIEDVNLTSGDSPASERVVENNLPSEAQYVPSMVAQTPLSPITTSLADKKDVVAEKSPPAVIPEFKREEKKIEPKPDMRNSAIPENRVVTAVAMNHDNNASAVAVDDVIKLSATAESWAEVQDADNNRLFYSLIKTGDSHSIKGRAPFKVFLGNAPSVSIEVNNQVVDISHYVRPSKIAHVKINAKAAAQFGGIRDVNQVIDQYIPETPAGVSRTE